MLAILTSHPIQYQAPLWRALAEVGTVPFEVWFLTDHAVKSSHDREFDAQFYWDRDLLEGYPYRFLPVRDGWRLDSFSGIRLTESWRRLFKEHGVTRLWVEGWRFSENWAAIFSARWSGIEVWMRGETNDLKVRTGLREKVRRVLLKILFNQVRYFLCIGTANRRFYRSFGIKEESLKSAPYSVDNDWFKRQADVFIGGRASIRRSWRIPDDAFCVLFCGKFIPKKRPLDLVQACRKIMIKDPRPPVHLLFVGSGRLGADLKNSCLVVYDEESKFATVSEEKKSMQDAPRATFAGFLNQSEIIRAYLAADCLVLPSDSGETWGLVVNEGMSIGLPCIVSDQCGCAEDIVSALSKSAVFPMGDVDALSRAIMRYYNYPPLPAFVKSKADNYVFGKTIDTVISLMTGDKG